MSRKFTLGDRQNVWSEPLSQRLYGRKFVSCQGIDVSEFQLAARSHDNRDEAKSTENQNGQKKIKY